MIPQGDRKLSLLLGTVPGPLEKEGVWLEDLSTEAEWGQKPAVRPSPCHQRSRRCVTQNLNFRPFIMDICVADISLAFPLFGIF